MCGFLGKFPIHVRRCALAASFILNAGVEHAMPVSSELTEQNCTFGISSSKLLDAGEFVRRSPVAEGTIEDKKGNSTSSQCSIESALMF